MVGSGRRVCHGPMNTAESVALGALVSLSNHFGSQTDYVIAGG